jgi:hypothetical protein
MDTNKLNQSLVLLAAVVSIVVGIYAIATNPVLAVIATVIGGAFTVTFLVMRLHEPYEFRALDNQVVVDICDNSGKLVHYEKRTCIKALRKNIFYYIENMAAETETDGRIDGFETEPGVVESVRQQEGEYLIKTTLGKHLSKGEEIVRYFRCNFVNCFVRNAEYFTQKQVYPTEKFIITIKFPPKRTYRSFRSHIKVGTYELYCPQPEERVLEGRPCLVWEIKKPRLKDKYVILWHW